MIFTFITIPLIAVSSSEHIFQAAQMNIILLVFHNNQVVSMLYHHHIDIEYNYYKETLIEHYHYNLKQKLSYDIELWEPNFIKK